MLRAPSYKEHTSSLPQYEDTQMGPPHYIIRYYTILYQIVSYYIILYYTIPKWDPQYFGNTGCRSKASGVSEVRAIALTLAVGKLRDHMAVSINWGSYVLKSLYRGS